MQFPFLTVSKGGMTCWWCLFSAYDYCFAYVYLDCNVCYFYWL